MKTKTFQMFFLFNESIYWLQYNIYFIVLKKFLIYFKIIQDENSKFKLINLITNYGKNNRKLKTKNKTIFIYILTYYLLNYY